MAFVNTGAVGVRGQWTGAAVCSRAAVGRKSALRMAAAAGDDFVPDMDKRNTMNLLLVGAAGLPGTAILGSFAYFLYPNIPKTAGGGAIAKDANGDNVTKAGWLSTHGAGDRKLVEGLKGDATYLIVNEEKDLEYFGLNAICTHLGCVVPWNKAANKFMCPCHGSQYDKNGKVVRGPAPLSLALTHVEEDEEGNVVLKPWTEEDFRDGSNPWWIK